MKNRVFSAITAFIMLISCLTITTVSAAERTVHELGNFRDESINPSVSGTTVAQDNNFGYGTNTNSLLWTVKASVYYMVENNTDWTAYDDVRIRLHSSDTQKINIVFCGIDSVTGGKYTNMLTEVKGGEWQEIVVPISELTTGLNASEDKKSIVQICFDGSGWHNTEYVSGSKVHIDSICLTKAGFQILNTQPQNGASGVDASAGFKYTISFNNNLDEGADYGEYISVSDNDGNIVENYTAEAAEKALTLTFNDALKPETEYTVTVAGDLSDADGNVLGEDGSFTFTTGSKSLTYELVNFREESINPNVTGSNISQANDFGYGDSSNSLLWTIRGDVNYVVENNTNWTAYDDVRIRLYSSADQKLNAIFYGVLSGTYKQLRVDVKGEQWQEIVVPISELAAALNASPDKRSIAQVSLNGPGWSNKEYVRDSQVYIDSIYLTKEGFKILSTQPEDGASGVDASEGLKYTISFNKELAAQADYGEYISVADADGNIVENYTVEAAEKALTLTFNDALKYETEYTVKIAGDLSDADGNVLGEDGSFTFTTGSKSLAYELVNFREESINPNVTGSNVSQSNDFGYGGSSNSLLWTIRGNVNYTVENNTNWTEYDDVRIRLYSSADQKLNAIFYGVLSGTYKQLRVDVKGEQWQEIVVPISELAAALNASPDKRSIAQVSLAGPGWSNPAGPGGYVRDSQVYIDSIYLTKEGFKILSTQPEDGASGVDASAGLKYTISFNKELAAQADYGEYISVAEKGGGAVENYTAAASEKALTLTFNEALKYETEYTVKVAGGLTDVEGDTLGDDVSFTFTTGGEPLRLGDDGVIFSAASDEDMENILTNGAVEETENSSVFDRAARIEYKAGVDKTAVLAYKHGDISGYTHVNYFMYNPTASAEEINMLMYDKNGEYYRNTVTTDWTGWELISQPIPENAAVDPKSIVRFSMSFGAAGSEDGYVILGKAWLSDHEIGALSLEETEYKNEEGYVPSDLGGDNKFSFTFDRELEAVTGDVEVSRLRDGEYVPYEEEFTAEVDGNKLNVVFEPGPEDGGTYKIFVPAKCVLAKDFGTNDEPAEISFTVGTDAPYFRLVSISPENESMITELEDFTVTLTFNKTPNRMLNHEDYISVYKGDDKQFGIFDAETEGNSIVLRFNRALEAGKKYTVKINEEYSDNFGNKISGDTEFIFYTYEESSDDNIVTLFSAGDPENLSKIAADNGSGSVNTSNPNLYPSNLKCTFPEKKDIGVYILRDNIKPTAGMAYANFWLYSPEAIEENMNIIFYTDRSSNRYTRYSLLIDWEGWKLVSVPLADVSSPERLDSVALNFGGWSTPHNKSIEILVDEAWLSADVPSPPVFVFSSVPEGYIGVAAKGASITYEFNEELNADKGASVTVTNKSSNEEFTDYTTQISGKQIAVKFGALDENTEYQVEINGLCSRLGVEQRTAVVHSFTTSGKNVYVSSISFDNTEIIAGDVLTANFEITNSGSKRGNVICKLNLYDENNMLVSKREYGLSCGGVSEETAAVSIDTPKGAAYAIAYVVDFDGNIISDKFVTLKNGKVSGNNQIIITGDSAKLQLDEASVSINNLSVKGTVGGISNTVILTIADSDNNIVTEIPLSADAAGKFEYGGRMPSEAQSGKYTITAAGGEMRKDTAVFDYISNADRDEFLALSNGSDANAVAKWITENAEALGMSGYSSEQIADFARVLLEQDTYDTYKEAISGIGKIADMLKGLNSCTWAGLNDYLIRFHDTVLGRNSADYTYFAGLAERNRNTILIEVAKSMPVQTITNFRNAFSAAVSAYKGNAPTTPPGSSTGGGGAGGGGGGSSSGGGGGVTYVPGGDKSVFVTQYSPPANEENVLQPTIAPQQEMFNDLADYPWAKESIEALCGRGIIAEADSFRPGDSITREEFVKLIVCAFCGGLTTTEHEFSDADSNAWYSPYLQTAYAENIVEGYSDGRFGIGESITREDMVTMVGRTISKIGKMAALKDEGIAFNYSDADSISDYALEYVKAMTACGVVSGMGDGSFAPKAVTNRAQAAKVIYRILELTD